MCAYFIPASPTVGTAASGYKCSWYATGASGGVNIDGGTSADPETGRIYVGGQSGLSTIQVQKDPCSEFRYSSPHDSCGFLGALAAPPGYGAHAGNAPGNGFEGRPARAANRRVRILHPKPFGRVTPSD